MLVAEVSAIAQGKICLVAAPLAPPCPTTVIPLVGAVVVARMRLVVPPAGVAPSESPRTKSTKIKLRNKVIPYLLEVTVVTVAVCQVVVDRWRLRRGVRRQESKDMPRRSSVKVKSADYHLLRFSEAPLTLAFSLSHTYLQTN